MRPALVIGHNDLRLFLRHRSSLVWLLAMPVAFTCFMGFAVRGPGGPNSPQPSIFIENHDSGFLGKSLLEAIGQQGLRIVAPTNRVEAKRGIRIPADLTQRVLDKEPIKVEFVTVQGANEEAAALVEIRVLRALVALNGRLVEHAVATAGKAPTEEGLRALSTRENPVRLDSRFAGRKPMPAGFNLSLPGNLVMYVLMNLMIFGGSTVAAERRYGVLRRLMIHPISRGTLIIGKVYGLMLLGSVQIAVMLLVGQFLLGVNLGDHLLALLFTLVIYAWVAASLGVLVCSVVTAEEKVIGLCLLVSLPMDALGGCWWPLEIVPDFIKVVAHLVPTAWAMDALHQLITFGGGFAGAKGAVGMLLLFGLAANIAAAKCFRW
jgi:ABC-type multidrug transport system permease subunit